MNAPDSVSPPTAKKAWVWVAIGLAVAFLGVFVLPWTVPFPSPVKGESYSYGFYNPVGVLALYAALVPVLIGLLRGGEKPVALSWFVPSPVIFPPWRQGAFEYFVLAVSTVVIGAVVIAWNAYLVNPYWGEAPYFLSNIDLVRLGYRPYTDFSFSYGPAFLYAPIAIDRLSGGSLGIENAYADCIVLAYALGFLLFFILLRFLNIPDRDRPWILALTLLIWFLLTMGLQYTPLRFAVAPCLLALGNHPRLYRTPGLLAAARLLGVIAVLTTACFLVSPEMGVACSFGFAASAAIHLWSRRILSAVGYILGVGVAIALLTSFSDRYLHTASSIARGAFCFPIYPNHANLILILAALYVLPLVAYAILRQPESPAAPLAAALGSAAALLLPGAFGRADPGHVLINGLVIYLLLFAAFGQIRRSFVIGWGTVFCVTFVIFSQLSYWSFYAPMWRTSIHFRNYYDQHPQEVENWSRDWEKAGAASPNYRLFNWHKVAPYPKFGRSLADAKDAIAAPFGADLAIDRFLKVRAGFFPPYYCMVDPELFTPQDVARLVEETRKHADFVVIPDTYLAGINADRKHRPDGTQMQPVLNGLMMYPVQAKFRNKPYIPEVETAETLLPDNTIVDKDGTYTLLKLAK